MNSTSQIDHYTVKKITRFYGKISASGYHFFYRYFYGRLPVEHFRNQDMVGLCQPTVLENTFVGLYDKINNVLCYRSVPDS